MKQIQEDKIISEFLKSLGPWREFVVIGGGFALFIYKLYLADPRLENLPVGTRDIDSLIPRKVPEISKKNIAKYLNEAGFTHVFKDVDIPATESFVKEIDGEYAICERLYVSGAGQTVRIAIKRMRPTSNGYRLETTT